MGCSDFDTKPVDLLRLLGKIEKCLAKKKMMSNGPAPAADNPSASQSNAPARPLAIPMPAVDASCDIDPALALTGSMRDFRDLRGKDLIARVGNFYEWQRLRRNQGLWPYSKATEQAPLAVTAAQGRQRLAVFRTELRHAGLSGLVVRPGDQRGRQGRRRRIWRAQRRFVGARGQHQIFAAPRTNDRRISSASSTPFYTRPAGPPVTA